LIEKAKYVFQTKGDVFVLTCSGTGGVECAMGNVVKPGDKIVVPTFGLFGDRMKKAAEAYGGSVVEIPVEWGKAVEPEQIEAVMEREENVKVVGIVANETSTGVKAPRLKEIGEVTKRYGALLIVDAISILGGDHMPVDEWNIDVCVTASQKCLASLPGLALLSVSDKAWETIEANPSIPFYFNLIDYRRYLEKRRETPFTPSVPLFYALDEALTMIIEEGLENRVKRHLKCAEAFYSSTAAMGLASFTSERYRSPTVIAVKVPEGVDDGKVRDIMREDHGVIIAGSRAERLRGLIFRIGSMGIVSRAEVERTIDALGKSLLKVGWNAKLEEAMNAARRAFAAP
jgi:aspartate aminotransferase-like enzyme